jgi:hypothetical protein
MPFRSNYREVAAAVSAVPELFNPRRRTGRGKRLGDEVADVVAMTIVERTRQQQLTPDRRVLARLKPATVRRKVRKGAPILIGVESGQMLDLEEVRGKVTIIRDAVAMEYGLGPEMEARAEFFQEGRPGVQESRPFYDLGRDGQRNVEAYVDEVAEDGRKAFEGG